MRLFTTLMIGSAAAALVPSASADAALLNFEISGSRTASFQLDSNPVPSSTISNALGTQILFNNVPGTFNNVTGTAGTIRFGTGSLAAFQINGAAAFGFAPFTGSRIFTGSLTAPMFAPGVFQLSSSSGNIVLTISQAGAIPEPATWAMMIAGFGLVGSAMRRRAPRFAAA